MLGKNFFDNLGNEAQETTPMTSPREIEVKFFLTDPDATRRQIRALGGDSADSIFESNIRYEDPARSFLRRGQLLRLRKDDGVTLTFKSNAPESDRQFKVRRELEVKVDDFDRTDEILRAIGFHREQIYEKYRETYRIDGAVLCLDRMPFGSFLEIEGDRSSIRRLADALEMDWDRRILVSYLAIFGLLRKASGFDFSDVTFANFRAIGEIDLSGILSRVEAGPG